MGPTRVDTLRQGYEAWNRLDMDEGLALLDPDIEWHPPADSPFAGPYRGIAEVRRFFESMLETFDEIRREPLEFVERGNRVLVPVRSYVRGVGSGVGVEVALIDMWEFRDLRAVRYEVHADTPATRKALGLDPRA